jgi:hypothetical protein
VAAKPRHDALGTLSVSAGTCARGSQRAVQQVPALRSRIRRRFRFEVVDLLVNDRGRRRLPPPSMFERRRASCW